MQSQSSIEQKLRELKPLLINKFHVDKIGYFGSYATQEQNEESDLDLLVEFSEPVGWQFFSLEKFLEEQLSMKIDLVTRNALKERLKDRILKQVKYV
jgi:hypothetical protein